MDGDGSAERCGQERASADASAPRSADSPRVWARGAEKGGGGVSWQLRGGGPGASLTHRDPGVAATQRDTAGPIASAGCSAQEAARAVPPAGSQRRKQPAADPERRRGSLAAAAMTRRCAAAVVAVVAVVATAALTVAAPSTPAAAGAMPPPMAAGRAASSTAARTVSVAAAIVTPTAPTALRRPLVLAARQQGGCSHVMPGCYSQQRSFRVDVVQNGCGSPTKKLPLALNGVLQDTRALFRSVVNAGCCASAWTRASLDAHLHYLFVHGGCGAPYNRLPEWHLSTTSCKPPAVCAAAVARISGDFGPHGCVGRSGVKLDRRVGRLRRTLASIAAARCCTVAAQRRWLAADTIVIAQRADCAPVAARQTAGAMAAFLGGGVPTLSRAAPAPAGGGVPTASGTAAAAAAAVMVGGGVPARVPAAAAPRAGRVPAVSRPTATFDSYNPAGILAHSGLRCCGLSFPNAPGCCSMWCVWAAGYLGQLVAVDDCCVGAQTWACVRSCDALN